MKHIQTVDHTPIPSVEDATLQQCHTLSLSITHPGFHHIAQLQCCRYMKNFLSGHYKQAPEVWVYHSSVIFWILVAISETAKNSGQNGNFAFQVAKRHPGLLSFSFLYALISLLHKYFVNRKIYRPPQAIYDLQLSPSTSLSTFRFLSQRNQPANSSTALLTLTYLQFLSVWYSEIR